MEDTDAPLKGLLLVGTSTLWKNAEYSGIAFANEEDGIEVHPLSYFRVHHSAIEDEETAEQNLAKKYGDITKASDHFRKGGNRHASFMEALAKNGIHFEGGKEAAMLRTYVMGDDTTQALPKALWFAILPELKKLVVPGSLKASPCTFKEDPGEEYMSVADIGPILSSIGQEGFWRLVRHAAAKIERYKHEPIKTYHQVSCAVSCLNDPEGAPPHIIKAHTLSTVYAPNGLLGEVPTSSKLLTFEDFICLPENPAEPISANYGKHLLAHSTRKKIYDQFRALLRANEKVIQKASNIVRLEFSSAANDTGTHISAKRTGEFTAAAIQGLARVKKRKRANAKLKVVQPTIGALEFTRNTHTVTGNYLIRTRTFLDNTFEENRSAFLSALSMEFSSLDKKRDAHAITEHADALFFAPFDATDERARAYNYLMLRCAFVAKALDRRYHHVPLIILNHKGCWEPAIQSHISYANCGYNKEFIRAPVHDHLRDEDAIVTTPNVEHVPLFYADVLNGECLRDLAIAAQEIACKRLSNYNRIDVKKHGSESGGQPRPEGFFGIAGFGSASSDKLADFENGAAIGRIVGSLPGTSLTTGGMDQHSGYAFIPAYNEVRQKDKSHLTCVSTHDIVKVETSEGRLPPCDYWELHDTIGPRLATLVDNDLFISIGGGDGTGQETGLVLFMKIHAPELVRDKNIIFVGRDPSMHAEISSIIGESEFNNLRVDPYALSDVGIFLFDNAGSAAPAIKMAYDQFNASAPRKAGPEIVLPLARIA